MSFNCYFLLIFFLFLESTKSQEQRPTFYTSRAVHNEFSPLGVNFENSKVEHSAVDNSVNADSIIGPIMQPIARMFEFVSENRKNVEYAEKFEEQKKASMFDPESFLIALNGKDQPNQTPSPSLMEKLFEPFISPVKREMNRIKATTPASIFDKLFEPAKPADVMKEIRRAQPIYPPSLPKPAETNALASLLQPLGVNGDQNAEEVQIGRDRTISVLGMPVGRRDGLALSPLRGMSYGNQNMYGPIAVNDKYNLQWDFLNKIGSMFDPNHDQSFLKNVMTIFGQN